VAVRTRSDRAEGKMYFHALAVKFMGEAFLS
jgi:hypothetical protein